MSTVKREIEFHREFVSCTHCEVCYSGRLDADGKHIRTFCQEFSKPVDPEKVEENQRVAQQCKYFVPEGLSRRRVVTPDRERHYEKDSMA